MTYLYIDCETQNDLPLKGPNGAGTAHYAETCRLLSIHWAIDDGPVQRWEAHKDGPYIDLDGDYTYVAHNALFDRLALVHNGYPEIGDPKRWVCTAALSRFAGFPGSLDKACKAAGVSEHKHDVSGGIGMFTKREPYSPLDRPDEWAAFMKYGDQDVRACRALFKRLPACMPRDMQQHWRDFERWIYLLEQRVNERGFYVDREVVESAAKIILQVAPLLDDELAVLTAGSATRVTQRQRILDHLLADGLELPDMKGETIDELLGSDDLWPDQRRILELRSEGSQTSLAKYTSMGSKVSSDNRCRGSFLYFGAHTGRWSGAGVQPQNLARPGKGLDCAEVAECIREVNGDLGVLRMLYDEEPLSVLKSGIRGAITAPPGRTLVVADYAQIEARIMAYEACCVRLLEAFAAGEDIYVVTAREALRSGNRHAGKQTALGCQYGMGYKRFAALNKIEPDLARVWVTAWRQTFNEIPSFWNELHHGFLLAMGGTPSDMFGPHGRSSIAMLLPSGRSMLYHGTRFQTYGERLKAMKDTERREATLGFMERNRLSNSDLDRNAPVYRNTQGNESSLWGGTIAENRIQAIARDVMAWDMQALSDLDLVAHAHDELIFEVDERDADEVLARVLAQMSDEVEWLPGCPLGADGMVTKRYTKM